MERFCEIESGRYCPDCIGSEFDGEQWKHYTVEQMLDKAEEWRDVKFDEFTPPIAGGWAAKQWREWCAALNVGGGVIHALYRSNAAPARIFCFLEDIQF